ncbi:hypothetical protein C3408_21880 [Candidatus Pantoea alvi]|nr:hypothetical protein C3408_21880 [Pantoea alvi]
MDFFPQVYNKPDEIPLCRRSGLVNLIIIPFDAPARAASGPDAYFASRFSYDLFYRHVDFL